MAVQNPFSEYQQAARQKWPTAQINGDGPFALVCSITEIVRLYSFWMEAMNDLTKNHSNWTCRDRHKLVELKPAPQAAPRSFRNLERD
jgi:hypothetical protein